MSVRGSRCTVTCSSPKLLSHPPPATSSVFHHPAAAPLYTLSLHDALPICQPHRDLARGPALVRLDLTDGDDRTRSEEHTSELQSPCNLVCRLLLEKKKFTELRESNTHGYR